MEYEHKGIKIAFDADKGQFSARIAGEFVKAASLSAIKKRIDKSETFEQFAALVRPRGWGSRSEFERVTIVGIKKPVGKQSWSNTTKWIDSNGHEYEIAHPDTPDNEAALNARAALQKKHYEEKRAVEARHFEEMKAADALIVTRLPNA